MRKLFLVMSCAAFTACASKPGNLDSKDSVRKDSAAAKFDPESFGKDIEAEENNLCRMILMHNDSLVIYYDANARLCPPDTTFFSGKDDICRFWKSGFSREMMSRTVLSLNGNADLFYETGIESGNEFIPRGQQTSQPISFNYKYVHVWKRQPDNSYKIAFEMWNSIGQQ